MSEWILIAAYWAVIPVMPVLTIWGWIRWRKMTQPRILMSDLSFAGFALATASVLLAALTVFAAMIRGGFPYYDPLLLTIYKIGLLLSLGGLIFGICGIWRIGPVRWHAPICALGMLLFWLLSAASE